MSVVNGTWERVFSVPTAQADADEDLDWAVSVDSTIVRAHQHAAGSPKNRGSGRRTGRPRHRPLPRRTDHEIRLAAEGRCRPSACVLTAAGRRRSRLHGRDVPTAYSPALWTAAHQAGCDHGRQGVLRPRDPRGFCERSMDLVHGACRVMVLLEHTAKDGSPKILKAGALPLTSECCVHRGITDPGFLDITPDGLAVVESAPGVTIDDIRSRMEAP
ncbi:CoA-transferase [Streptomyces sp. NPDC007896]|uniref:CoA-transferase n=1 Tax=Streptomyces sp. NPDC007896 TaxID=3364784 RepID=UPI0036F00874